MRMASDRRWPAGGVESIDQGANSGYAPRVPERFAPGEDASPPEVAPARAAQTFQIKYKDWLEHGSTPGCPKCSHAQVYGWGKMGGPHAADCVERFRKIFMETEAGQQRLERAEQRRQIRAQEEGGDDARAEPPPAVPAPPTPVHAPPAPVAVPTAPQPPGGHDSDADDEAMGGEGGADQTGTNDQSGDTPMDHGDVDTIEPILSMMGGAESKEEQTELKKHWREILTLVESIGGHTMKYAREMRKQVRAVLSEIYSPERVTAAAKLLPGLGIAPGFALDVTRCNDKGEPWDFDIAARREEALAKVESEKPMMLVGSPMCTAFCAWQKLNEHKKDPERAKAEWAKAMVHLKFVCQLYELQAKAGRYFLHEHPVAASSWRELCIRKILGMAGVARVNGDQCQYGQQSADGEPIKKGTGWMSNSPEVLNMLGKRCQGRGGACSRPAGGTHKVCSGQVAKLAAIYPFQLCKAILQGFRNQLRVDGLMEINVVGMQVMQELHYNDYDYDAQEETRPNDYDYDGKRESRGVDEEEYRLVQRRVERSASVNIYEPEAESREGWCLPADEAAMPKLQAGVAAMEAVLSAGRERLSPRVTVFKDTITGQELNPVLVRAARKKEMDYFASKGVWALRPRSECLEKTGRRPVTVKWVDVNKGDDDEPNYRSRLVAREIRLPGEDPIFAPTPPLESVRMVLSLAATNLPGETKHVREAESEWRTQISIIDISRAYFNAKKSMDVDPTYVELPEEDPAKASGMCGLLKVHMYGTRAAADGWHGEYSTFMKSIGFVMGDFSACVFRHKTKRITSSVHGDDFTTAGPKCELDWLKAEMSKRYELTENYRLGPGPKDTKEGKILNRIVRWTAEGLEYEADPRQAEKLITSLGLDGAASRTTPGVKVTREAAEGDVLLPAHKLTPFRAVSARGNFLGPDRPEIQFATKEICRWMSQPSENGVAALKRLGRYLEGHRRLVFEYPWQEASGFEIYSDTDWAGCVKTRKSTSGGCMMLGRHLLKSWSSTQGLVSLSSGEAEFYGVTKAAGIALGMRSLMRDLGTSMKVRVWTDSSAAMGICGRQGLGKLRHIDTRSLWVQQRLRVGDLELRKVRGEVNPADLFTKHLPSGEKIADLLMLLGCRFRGGRPGEAPRMRKEGGGLQADSVLTVDKVLTTSGPTAERDGYHYPTTIYEGEVVLEAFLHDDRLLPHQVPDLERFFPRATAPPELEEESEEEDWLELKGLAAAGATSC